MHFQILAFSCCCPCCACSVLCTYCNLHLRCRSGSAFRDRSSVCCIVGARLQNRGRDGVLWRGLGAGLLVFVCGFAICVSLSSVCEFLDMCSPLGVFSLCLHLKNKKSGVISLVWLKSSYSTDVFSQRKPGEPAADGAHKHSWPYHFVYAVLNSWSKTKLLVVTEQFLRFPLPPLTLELLQVSSLRLKDSLQLNAAIFRVLQPRLP